MIKKCLLPVAGYGTRFLPATKAMPKGRYILTSDIFDLLETTEAGANGEIQITDALSKQAIQGNVIACKFKGKRFDCGNVPGFVEATNYVYKHIYRSND